MRIKKLNSLNNNFINVSNKLDKDNELRLSIYCDYLDTTVTNYLTKNQVVILRDHLNKFCITKGN